LKKRDTKQNPDRVLEIVLKTNPDLIYCNTIVCNDSIKRVKQETKIPVMWHIHELELGVKLTNVDPSGIIQAVDRVVANSEATAAFLSSRFSVDTTRIRIHYPVLPANNVAKAKKSNDKFLIGSSGTALSHKGALLFVRLAAAINRKYPGNNFLFKWIGNHKTLKQELEHDIIHSGLEGKVIFTGELENPFEAYSEFDFFVSLSKEESFGLACMEVAAIGIPVGGFEGTGGIEELLRKCEGLLVPYLDVEKMADSLVELSRDEKRLKEMADKAAAFSRNFLPEKIIPGWIESIDEVLTGNKTT
jgi:glycosyltransferase involved in cell wall biosynthesis